MGYPVVKLKNVCSKIGSGATPRGGSKVYVENGVSLIRSQNVYNLKFSNEGLVFISDEVAKKLNGVTIEKNDVLLNITGDSVARTCLVPDNVLPARVNQHVSIIRTDDKKLNPKFLSYYLASPYMQSYMLGLAVGKGASRNAMTKNMIEEFNVACPPLDYQQRIVDILHNYDKLIENNNKQIILLEEAAQRLYKEWFIDFRFPGWRSAKFINGIPSCLNRSIIGEYVRIKSGYAFKSDHWRESGFPVLKIKNIENNTVFNSSFSYISKEVADQVSDYLLSKGDVVIAMTGATIGKIAMIPDIKNLYINQRVAKIIPKKELINATPFLFCYYNQKSISEQILAISSSSSAQANISTSQLESFEVIANVDYINKFNNATKYMFKKIICLYKQNALLVESRDRLLPKLMNGEISV